MAVREKRGDWRRKILEKRLRDYKQAEQNNEALSLCLNDEGKMRGKRTDEGEVST